jgi:pimeloyl-ACP methyl ester carboxylesterase
VHGFGTPAGAYWNTGAVSDGRYRIRVTAWDPLGHATTRGIDVRIDNN